jgi:acyl-[acyl-carrier-protein]-phospholipid O-acyltransferase/long-chain-fatty-acid--[acyl-carrier-protein] ligase
LIVASWPFVLKIVAGILWHKFTIYGRSAIEAERAKSGLSLGEHFIRVARRNWRRRCISDSTGRSLNYAQTLINSIALSAEIEKAAGRQERVGIILPPSVGAALANIAVTLAGKVAVNLNYVVSKETIESAVQQCGISCIISSRGFAEKVKGLDSLRGLVFLEDIAGRIKFASKLKAYLKARSAPVKLLVKNSGELATVIFSSGSSGEPKGVMLSHRNIISNIEAVRTAFRLKSDDNLCGVLPFFHSFGFTCSLWLAVISGVSASYVASPLDGGLVGRSTRQNKSTILFATPTFLLNYIRRTRPDDFVSLRTVVVGAEKLKRQIADSFEDKFGLRPLEGYGTTELSPVVSLNLPEELSCGLCQVGYKEGTAGRPIPGVEVKVVCPDSSRELPAGQSGLLMVKGPNVMLGYLNKEKETVEVLQNGWYNTGDIASIDNEGFLTITDRLSRFSKIAGEMVPHLGVEQAYLQGLETVEQVVAVTGVPEPRKGEELVVLYMDKAGGADKLHKIISQSSLPNMWKPRKDSYIRIESIPVLGSGKLDIMRLKKLALAAHNNSVSR